MTDAQEIRAVALTAAARFHSKGTWTPYDHVVLATAERFEAWIIDGRMPAPDRPGQ